MTTQEVAEAVEDWAADTASLNTFPSEPSSWQGAFPLAAGRVVDDQQFRDNTDHSEHVYQQTMLQVFTVELAVLVEPDPAWTSDQALYAIMDLLKASLNQDNSLGERVEAASPLYQIVYDGEAEMEDGTRANLARMTISLSQKVEAS